MRRYLVSLMKWPGARMQAAATRFRSMPPPTDALFMCARKVRMYLAPVCLHACTVSVCVFIACAECVYVQES